MSTLLDKIEAFRARHGLSEYRAGILLASNGRLVERLRGGGRVWPDTAEAILDRIVTEDGRRSPTQGASQ